MEMDPVCFSRDDLCHLALEIFEAAGLPAELAEDLERVRRFILAVRESMYDNAYHNFYHVFDVTQTVSVLARRTGTFGRLNAWDRFALLAAAFCHGTSPAGLNHLHRILARTCFLIRNRCVPPCCSACLRCPPPPPLHLPTLNCPLPPPSTSNQK